MTEPNIEYWDCDEHQEILTHDNPFEAIEYWLDTKPKDEWPETLEVYGFVRDEICVDSFTDSVLEQLLEHLDENHGNPEECTEETETMKKAAKEFVEKVAAEYQVWSCRLAKTETVNTTEWVKDNRPDWLEAQ